MIFTERKITIRNGKSSINEPVILYRGDYEVSIKFTIMESKFRFKSGVNLVDSEKASHGQLAILAPYGGNVFSEVVKCEDGTVTFTLTKEMIDQLEEVGLYSFQIRLFDYYRESRVSIPPVEFGIEVREPVASEDHDNEVNNAIVGYSIAKVVDGLNEDVGPTFDDEGNYNKTDWETGDRISQGKLNKIEDALDTINQNEIADMAALDKRITNNFNVLDAGKADKNEVFSMKNMGQDIKEAMTGGSVAVVGKNAILTDNILDGQVTGSKLADNYMHRDFAFLSEETDLNNVKKDGLYVVTSAINKPAELSSSGLLQVTTFCNRSGNPHWVLQEITDINDPKLKLARINNGEWANLHEELKVLSKFNNKQIMFLGDSIAKGVGATSSDYAIHNLFKELTGANTASVAIGGASWQLDGRYDEKSIVTQLENFNINEYEYVVIWAGTNDYGRGNTVGLPLGTIEDKEPTTSLYGAIRYVIEDLLNRKNDIKISLITPIFRNDNDEETDMLNHGVKNAHGFKLIDYCNAIIEVAKLYNIPVLDLYHTSNVNVFNANVFLTDGLHPNDDGYKLLTEKILAFMNSIY